MYFDSHAHLNDEKFFNDLDEIIKKMKEIGVSLVMVPGADLESSIRSVKLSKEYDIIYSAVGIHPHDSKEINEEKIGIIRNLAKEEKVKAIGEIGLDYYYDFSPKEDQIYWFERQLELANELKMPVIIHDRDAHKDVIDTLIKMNSFDNGVLMHCYSGSLELMKEYVKLGAYISIAGPVTFNNAVKLTDVATHIPIDRILIETDSPYLSPVPNRGKRNDPSNVVYVAKKIASLRNISIEEFSKHTMENGKRFFRIW
jgi:TatD DNase family protein